MEQAPKLRGVAPADDPETAAVRLYQGLYGCTLHPAGLLHSIAAILGAEAEGRFTLADVATATRARAEHGLAYADPGQAWRYEAMIALCQRLTTSAS